MKKKMFFTFAVAVIALCSLIFFFIFSAKGRKIQSQNLEDCSFKLVMMSDLGGINDQSFNQSAWEGLKSLKNNLGDKVSVSYAEPKQTSDFSLILDKLADGNYNVIYAIGYALCDSLYDVATLNLDKNFVIVDYDFAKNIPNNVTCIKFYSQESSLLAGYVAGKTTKTNKVGFLGGMRSDIIDQFEYGFKAGVYIAAKELGKEIEVIAQYADSFTDVAKGKAIGTKLYNSGCDIAMHAAGPVGLGLIESAKEHGTFAIGVDKDQSDICPECVLTSAMKNVGKAVELVGKSFFNKEDLGGKTLVYGAKEGCVGIPKDYKLMGKSTYDATVKILEKICDGKISLKNSSLIIPYNEETYNQFIKKFNGASK